MLSVFARTVYLKELLNGTPLSVPNTPSPEISQMNAIGRALAAEEMSAAKQIIRNDFTKDAH